MLYSLFPGDPEKNSKQFFLFELKSIFNNFANKRLPY